MVDTLTRPLGPRHVRPAVAATAKSGKRKPSRGARFQSAIATLLIVGGLAMGGSWAWNTFGTTWMMRDQMDSDIQEFNAQIPQAPADIVGLGALHTDFAAFPPPEVDMDALKSGEPFGILTVPSWQGLTGVKDEELHNQILVKQGSDDWDDTNKILDTGAAVHYTETVGPGDVGNFSLSAHRRSRGDNFLYLPDLANDDWILLETKQAWYVYRVIGNELVTPTDMHVVNPDPFSPVNADGTQNPTRRLITLTTCTLPNGSPWGNSHRWIVHGELYGWMEREAGTPPMINNYWVEADSPISEV